MKLLLVYSVLTFSFSASSQICKLVETTNSAVQKSLKKHSYEPDQRMEKLQELIHPDSLRYLDLSTIDDEEPYYFEFDTSGTYLMDLNADGALDLIYVGISGPMGRTTTVYLNIDGTLERITSIDGRLLEIDQKSNQGISIYTLWKPCCDSYTNRIESYEIVENEVSKSETISFIGNSKIRHVPDFSRYEKKTLKKGAVLYAIDTDFRRLAPYFRDDNKEYKELMRNKKPLPMMTLDTEVKVAVLLEMEVEVYGEMFAAIVTDKFNAPKSHFEWSDGENIRIVSWVKIEDLQ